jgi:hypothetical protein
LIPKSQQQFKAHPKLPLVLPFELGERTEHAVRDHQWVEPDEKSGRMEPLFKTSGVSTTPNFNRAVHYAGNKIIARIDTREFQSLNITAHVVKEILAPELICVPEDEEIILTCPGTSHFPKALITEIIRL